MSSRRTRRVGFTLVELMAVLAVILVLVSILMPSLSKGREAARRVTCLSNLRQVAIAWTGYANDNDRYLVSADTWRYGWAGDGNADNDIRRGSLFSYVPDPEVYHCPSDPNKLNVRSYSISARLNGETGWGIPVATRLYEIRHPAECILAIEEFDPRGYNINSFIIYNSGDNWVDFPAQWHDKGTCMSFVDGRVEYWKWSDPRTSEITDFFAHTPNNPDLDRLHKFAGY